MRPRTRHASRGKRAPSTATSPPLGRSSVARMRSSVVFPDPLGPITTRLSPRASSRLTSSNATRSPYSRHRPARRIAGGRCAWFARASATPVSRFVLVATTGRIYPLDPIKEGAYLHNHDREPNPAHASRVAVRRRGRGRGLRRRRGGDARRRTARDGGGPSGGRRGGRPQRAAHKRRAGARGRAPAATHRGGGGGG